MKVNNKTLKELIYQALQEEIKTDFEYNPNTYSFVDDAVKEFFDLNPQVKKDKNVDMSIVKSFIKDVYKGGKDGHVIGITEFCQQLRKKGIEIGKNRNPVQDASGYDVLDANPIEENIKKLLKTLVKEEIFSIMGGSLQELNNVRLLPNSEYYMGASTSPMHIVVTKVDEKWIYYRTDSSEYKKDLNIELPIGKDLIYKGTKTYLNRYMNYLDAKTKKTFENNLKGKLGPNNGKMKPELFQNVMVKIETIEDVDTYGIADSYGGIRDYVGGTTATSYVERRMIPLMKNDKRIKSVTILKKKT